MNEPIANAPTPILPTGPIADPEIHVIPEKFYGAALKAKIPDAVFEASPAQITPPKRSPAGMIIAVCLVLLVGAGGVFVYYNRNLLFPAPEPQAQQEPQTPEPPVTPTAPLAPQNLSGSSANPQSASLSWGDTADETGYRVERAGTDGQFFPVTNLPQNSVSFMDSSVQPSSTYRYRIVALNQGGESPASAEALISVQALPPAPPEQPKLPPAGLDSDSDGLTDLEETMFGTQTQNPDTDADGFLDGNEAYNMYNPNEKAPAKLADSGLFQPGSDSSGWSMLLPKIWNLQLTSDGRKATVVTGHGETFVLTIEDNPKGQAVLEWYLAQHPEVLPAQVLKYRSKRGYEGIIGADLLSTFIPWGDKVFVFKYDLDGQTFINYRTTYYMMLNSLELKGLPVINVPSGSVTLPFEPSATSTGVINQPSSVEVFPPLNQSSVQSNEQTQAATTTL